MLQDHRLTNKHCQGHNEPGRRHPLLQLPIIIYTIPQHSSATCSDDVLLVLNWLPHSRVMMLTCNVGQALLQCWVLYSHSIMAEHQDVKHTHTHKSSATKPLPTMGLSAPDLYLVMALPFNALPSPVQLYQPLKLYPLSRWLQKSHPVSSQIQTQHWLMLPGSD